LDFWTTLKRVQQFLTNSPSTGQAANYVQNPKRFKVVADPDTNELVVLHTIEIQQNGKHGFIPGTGVLKSIAVTQPAAGANWIKTVPAGKVWRIQSIQFSFAASAAVANRQVHLLTEDSSGNEVFAEKFATAVTAGDTAYMNFGAGLSNGGLVSNAAADQNALGYPVNMNLPENFILTTQTDGMDAADQYSNVFVFVEEFTL